MGDPNTYLLRFNVQSKLINSSIGFTQLNISIFRSLYMKEDNANI